MKLIPSKKVLLVSPLSEERVIGILEDVISPKNHNTFRLKEAKKNTFFEGFIVGN